MPFLCLPPLPFGCDGFFPEKTGGYGFFFWQANRDRLPAWLLFEFQEPQSLGRVKVYTRDKPVTAATCEVLTEKGWQKVGEVQGNARPDFEFVFPPVKATAFRLNVLATEGKAAYVSEVEAYAK